MLWAQPGCHCPALICSGDRAGDVHFQCRNRHYAIAQSSVHEIHRRRADKSCDEFVIRVAVEVERGADLFDAAKYAALLSEIPSLVGPIEMELAMGATRSQFASLAADGLLVPRIDVPTIKSPWRVSDGLALLAELKKMAVPVDPSDKHSESIQRAKSRSSINAGTIIAAVRDGRLKLGRRTDVTGYAGFCVLKAEINEMALKVRPAPSHAHMTAAAFDRSIGKRGEGLFERLSAAGHTSSSRMPFCANTVSLRCCRSSVQTK
jgi:hypothetical protein